MFQQDHTTILLTPRDVVDPNLVIAASDKMLKRVIPKENRWSGHSGG